jgi:hypothetical protein
VAPVSIDARLDKLAPALTAKERAILILRASKEGVPQDPQIRSSMPPEQTLEFNRYIGLMNGVNIFLTFYTGILDQVLALLDARYGWLLTIHLWVLSVSDSGRKTRRPRKDSHKGEEIAEAVGTRLREGIRLRWQELRSIELVLEEVAAEFDGESPTRPWEREALDDGKTRLEELHRAAQTYVGAFKLPGPDEEEMEQVREVIRREGER